MHIVVFFPFLFLETKDKNSTIVVVLLFIYVSLFYKNAFYHRQFKNKRIFCKTFWQLGFGNTYSAFVVMLLFICVFLLHDNTSYHRQFKSKRIFCEMYWQQGLGNTVLATQIRCSLLCYFLFIFLYFIRMHLAIDSSKTNGHSAK